MPYCKNCGNELSNDDKLCNKCNTPVEQPKNHKENPNWAIIAIVFGILGGWMGLIASIVGLCVYKQNSKYRTICWIGLALSIVWFIIFLVVRL